MSEITEYNQGSYWVPSSRPGEPDWLVDLESNECACQEHYGRRSKSCRHLEAARKWVEEKKTPVTINATGEL